MMRLSRDFYVNKGKLKYDDAEKYDRFEKNTEVQATILELHEHSVSVKDIAKWLQLSPGIVRYVIKNDADQDISDNPYQHIVAKNVKWFLEHKKPVKITNATENFIKELLRSKMSARMIQDETGVSHSVITGLRTGERSVANLSLATVIKLVSYYKMFRPWMSREDVISVCTHFGRGDGGFVGSVNSHRRPTDSEKQLMPKKYADKMDKGNWTYIINIGRNHNSGVIISEDHKNVWYHYGKYANSPVVMSVCERYADVEPSKRTYTSAEYMNQDLA